MEGSCFHTDIFHNTHKPSIAFPLGESTSSTHKTGKRALLSSAPHLVKSQRKERGAKGNKKNPSFLSIEFRLMAPSLSSRQEFFLGKMSPSHRRLDSHSSFHRAHVTNSNLTPIPNLAAIDCAITPSYTSKRIFIINMHPMLGLPWDKYHIPTQKAADGQEIPEPVLLKSGGSWGSFSFF